MSKLKVFSATGTAIRFGGLATLNFVAARAENSTPPMYDEAAAAAANGVGSPWIWWVLFLVVLAFFALLAISCWRSRQAGRPAGAAVPPAVPAQPPPPNVCHVPIPPAPLVAIYEEQWIRVADGYRVVEARSARYYAPQSTFFDYRRPDPGINREVVQRPRGEKPSRVAGQRLLPPALAVILGLGLFGAATPSSAALVVPTAVEWKDNVLPHNSDRATDSTIVLTGVSLNGMKTILFQDPCVLATSWQDDLHTPSTKVVVQVRVLPCAMRGQLSKTVQIGYRLNGGPMTSVPPLYVQEIELARAAQPLNSRFASKEEIEAANAASQLKIDELKRQQTAMAGKLRAAQSAAAAVSNHVAGTVDRHETAISATSEEVARLTRELEALRLQYDDLREKLSSEDPQKGTLRAQFAQDANHYTNNVGKEAIEEITRLKKALAETRALLDEANENLAVVARGASTALDGVQQMDTKQGRKHGLSPAFRQRLNGARSDLSSADGGEGEERANPVRNSGRKK